MSEPIRRKTVSAASKQLLDLGLDPKLIEVHSKNVVAFTKYGKMSSFEIIDTCRIDNGAIFQCLSQSTFDAKGFISFVPAAGASSRWLAPLSRLIQALATKNHVLIEESLIELVDEGILTCPVPAKLRAFILEWTNSHVIPEQISLKDLLLDIESPKAFYPAVIEGTTFLDMKLLEDSSIEGLSKGIFVCPIGYKQDFYDKLNANKNAATRTYKVYEQGSSLATVRFCDTGEIVCNEQDLPSIVPAGHGALLKLLFDVKDDFPTAHSAWIRNIDNVVGVAKPSINATNNFLSTHELILSSLREVRDCLRSDDLSGANKIAGKLRETLEQGPVSHPDNQPHILWMAKSLFHHDIHETTSAKYLLQLFMRPLVTMGQVPNTAMDVGGTAVFAKIGDKTHKLCLEVPHASSSDKEKFLADPAKATHFNPVFVAMELPSKETLTLWENHPFWIIAKKKFRGTNVFYQESVLYEMIGCSAYTNLVFVESPRLLFNPHKGLHDAQRRYLKSWM